MPTASTFTSTLTIGDVISPGKSVGAHLATKLDLFSSDERTLTDELCDMLCIWFDGPYRGLSPVTRGPTTFTFTLSKTTQTVEAVIGADLEMIVSSPLGQKRCLLQAKVLDIDGSLRCDSSQGWAKLKQQLIDARIDAGDLAFLLIYVPARFLNGRMYGLGSYEQNYFPYKGPAASGAWPSAYGATVIAVNDLLDNDGEWICPDKVPHSPTGVFANGLPFWLFLMRLMLCSIGRWSSPTDASVGQDLVAYRRLAFGASEIEPRQWEEMQRMQGNWIPLKAPFEDDRRDSENE